MFAGLIDETIINVQLLEENQIFGEGKIYLNSLSQDQQHLTFSEIKLSSQDQEIGILKFNYSINTFQIINQQDKQETPEKQKQNTEEDDDEKLIKNKSKNTQKILQSRKSQEQDNDETQSVQKDQQEEEQKLEKMQDDQMGQYKKQNQLILDKFLKEHGKEINQFFLSYSKDKGARVPKVEPQDIPLMMCGLFHKYNITFHQSYNDKEEFFNQTYSYKILIYNLERFSQEKDPTTDPSKQNYTEKDFIDFIKYFLDNENDIFMKENINQQKTKLQQQEDNDSPQIKLLKKNIRENIDKYQKMLKDTKVESEIQVFEGVIDGLYKQLEKANKISNMKNQPTDIKKRKRKVKTQEPQVELTKEQKRSKAIQYYFEFYHKLQEENGKVEIGEKMLGWPKFLLFCKQFKLCDQKKELTPKSLASLFKKSASNFKSLKLSEFEEILKKLGNYSFLSISKENERVEALYKTMFLDEEIEYKKLLDQLNPPFGINEKDGFRLLPQDVGREIKLREIPLKQKEELTKRKQELDFYAKYYKQMNNDQQLPKSISNTNINLKLNQSHYLNNSTSANNSSIFNKQPVSKSDINKKWSQSEKISISDLKRINNDRSGLPQKPNIFLVQSEERNISLQNMSSDIDLQQQKRNQIVNSYKQRAEQIEKLEKQKDSKQQRETPFQQEKPSTLNKLSKKK